VASGNPNNPLTQSLLVRVKILVIGNCFMLGGNVHGRMDACMTTIVFIEVAISRHLIVDYPTPHLVVRVLFNGG
jgi:hypothetical protein